LGCYGIGTYTNTEQFFVGFIGGFRPKGVLNPGCWAAIQDQTRSFEDLKDEAQRALECSSLSAPPLPKPEVCPIPGALLFKPASPLTVCVWTEVRDLLKSLAGFLNNIDDLLVQCVPGSEKKTHC
jgi:hypothetical protein